MQESAKATRQERRSSWLILLGDLEFAFYGLLGAILLVAGVLLVGRAALSTASPFLIAAYGAGIATTVFAGVRDILTQRLSWISRGLLAAWGLCVAAVVITAATS